jgi:A/G-specific adenine glycosylase
MTPSPKQHEYARRLIAWQRQYGRHDLPWQGTHDPYRIWVSEIMLQQTQVDSVIPYYVRFLARFPDIATLASANEEEVMARWAGLGYYSRARNLHAAARRIQNGHNGRFPERIDAIRALPGIGRSTAAAIAAFAYDQNHAILDGNVKRVLARCFGITGWPGEKAVENRLWSLAETLLPDTDIRAYTQGLMDLGATLCARARPNCSVCPFAADCHANQLGRQGELPGARPRKTLPEKSTAMLILQQGADIFLEKRPAPGIWGGLWSLPEFSMEADPGDVVAGMGYHAKQFEKLPASKHAFTHFRLHIQPWLALVDRPLQVGEQGKIWLSLSEIETAALPSPVLRLLRTLGA